MSATNGTPSSRCSKLSSTSSRKRSRRQSSSRALDMKAETDILGDGGDDVAGIAEWRKRHEDHPILIVSDLSARRFKCKPRFSHAAGRKDGQQAQVGISQQIRNFCQITLS